MTRQRRGFTPPASGIRPRMKVLLMGLVAMLAGLGLASGALAYRWHVSSEADRLRSDGVPVTAYVSDRAGGSGRGSGIDRIELSYLYESRQYSTWIPCAGVTGCHKTPGPKMAVWVDPTDPGTFVAENGHTSGSLSFLMSWTTIPGGLFIAALATVPVMVGIRTKDDKWT